MGSYMEPLELAIRGILTVINPQTDDWRTRFQVVEELRNVVGSVESLRGATVEEYGSFVSNLFTKWGDLDISIQLPSGSYISAAGRKRKQALLEDLLKALRQKGGCHRLQFISHARVPILKFESKFWSICCDISIDNLRARIKSKFFLWINDIDDRFRDMVKEWAKSHDINNPKAGSFNSFSLTLLVIFHFQTCAPSILPPLRDIYHGNMVDDLKGVRADAEQRIAKICAENISRFRPYKSRPANRSSLAELFASFVAKFSQLALKAAERGICTYTGQWVELKRNTRWMPKTYAIFIEDPFEQPENAARTVSSRQLARISEVFETTRRRLLSSYQNQPDLLGPFARSELSQFVVRTPVANPSSGAVPPIAQKQRFMTTSAQIQQPYRVARHPGNIPYAIERPWRDYLAGAAQRTNNISNTSRRAPQDNLNDSSKTDRPQSNASNHQPPTQRTQNKPQHVWRARSGS